MNEENMKKFHPELAEYYQKGDCCTWIVELRKQVSEKDKEIERLNNKIKEQNLLLIEFQDMEQKLDIYKSKCEKANTYINEEIKKIQEHQYSTGVRRLNKIQNILNGSDK